MTRFVSVGSRVVFLLIGFAAIADLALARGKNTVNRVRLSDVSALTFYRDRVTTARRGQPIPQLSCQSGKLCKRVNVPAIQCRNVGDAGNGDVQWACDADLPTEFRMGAVNVSCEGYDSPEDEFVLKGSCGLEYRIELRDPGNSRKQQKVHETDDSTTSQGNNPFTIVLYVGIMAWFLYSFCRGGNRHQNAAPATEDANANPTFPSASSAANPSFRPNPTPNPNTGSVPPPTSYSAPPGSCGADATLPSTTTQNIRPGFWTGLAGGAVASYLYNTYQTSANNYSSTSSSSYRRPRSSSSRMRTRSSSFGSTSTSTGFGGTSRR